MNGGLRDEGLHLLCASVSDERKTFFMVIRDFV